MKKSIILLFCMFMVFLCGCSAKTSENGREKIDCVASRRTAFNNYDEDEIRVILYTDCLENPVNVAEEIVQKYKENDFHSMYFSSLSDKIKATVYLSKDDEIPVLTFEYNVDNQKLSNIISNKQFKGDTDYGN